MHVSLQKRRPYNQGMQTQELQNIYIDFNKNYKIVVPLSQTSMYCTENMGSKHPCTENIGSRHVMIKMENYLISCNYCSKVKNQNKNIKMSCVYKQGETVKSFLGKIIIVFVVAYITP